MWAGGLHKTSFLPGGFRQENKAIRQDNNAIKQDYKALRKKFVRMQNENKALLKRVDNMVQTLPANTPTADFR